MSPTLPYENTKTALALALMLSGETLTTEGFANEFSTVDLPHIIHRLRHRHGWLIDTVNLKVCIDPQRNVWRYRANYSLCELHIKNEINFLGAEVVERFIDTALTSQLLGGGAK